MTAARDAIVWAFPAEPLTVASFCTGIGGAELAMQSLGCFQPLFFSEIDPFCCAVLGERWPTVSNFGDLLAMDCSWWRGRIDVVWGSTPCQDFSFAGRRRGLKGHRGNLTLAFVDRVDEIAPTYVLWENVKGVLSDKTNAFGHLLGALAGEDGPLVPPGKRWTHAGYVLGPTRAVAWRTFDAQHGGVPQRRERVFLVGCPRGGPDPRDVLFESEGARRDTAPRREPWQAPAATLTGGAHSRGGRSDDDRPLVPIAFGGNNTAGPIDVSTALSAHGGPHGRLDFDSETFLVSIDPGVADTLAAHYGRSSGASAGKTPGLANAVVSVPGDITHALKAEGGDASEDGTGRGTPIIGFSAADDCGDSGDVAPTLRARRSVGAKQSTSSTAAIAFSAKDYGAEAAVDLAPTLRAMGHAMSHPNSGGQVAVAFAENDRGELRTGEVTGALARKGGKPGQGYQALLTAGFQVSESGLRIVDTHATLDANNGARRHNGVVTALGAAMRGREDGAELEIGGEVSNALRGASGGGSRALVLLLEWAEAICARVRRLTPLECERLQGLPDNHTRIPWGRRPAALCPDGPRYRVIGNGLALPDVRWLCARVAHVHHLHQLKKDAA